MLVHVNECTMQEACRSVFALSAGTREKREPVHLTFLMKQNQSGNDSGWREEKRSPRRDVAIAA